MVIKQILVCWEEETGKLTKKNLLLFGEHSMCSVYPLYLFLKMKSSEYLS